AAGLESHRGAGRYRGDSLRMERFGLVGSRIEHDLGQAPLSSTVNAVWREDVSLSNRGCSVLFAVDCDLAEDRAGPPESSCSTAVGHEAVSLDEDRAQYLAHLDWNVLRIEHRADSLRPVHR